MFRRWRDTRKIVPLLKLALPEDAGPSLVMSESEAPIMEVLVADLLVSYAIDRGFAYEYVAGLHCESLRIAPEALRGIAIRNMRRMLGPVEVQPVGPLHLIVAGGVFEASFMLLDDFWETQAKLVEGEIVADAPSRDAVVFTGSASDEGLEALPSSIESVHAECDPRHQLSSHLLLRDGSEWRMFEP